ncbi:hypothetical protein LZ30DRAFT_752604 [Colletotrichum cereale]|nr:hypothetical protein LZ30DRAFT_752604 [Colletotrichum cereale]
MLSWTQVIGLQSSVLVAAQDSSPRLVQRAPFDNMYYAAEGGDWACSSEQLRVIGDAIAEAVEVAQQTIRVLQKPGAEKSDAYLTWFGRTNANSFIKKRIIKHHYRIVRENLGVPSIPVQVNWDRKPKYQVTGEYPPVTTDSVVYACLDDTADSQEDCRNTAAFVTSEEAWGSPSLADTTMISFCPAFFSSRLNTKAEMERKWRQDSDPLMSRGMVLLHEVQHMATATTRHLKSYDYAYSAEQCRWLHDASKTQNAQNYALFALDISVYPEKGVAS